MLLWKSVLVVCGALGLALSTAPPAIAADAKIALILNQPEGDPFGDLVYSGLEHLQSERGGIELKRIAGVQATAYEQQVLSLVNQGYNPLLVLWDDLAAVVAKLAPDYPGTNFIVVDSYSDPGLPNVATVAVDPATASYLGGVVAASLSTTNTLGFVGGNEHPIIQKFFCGFQLGAQSVKPDEKFVVNYAGTFIDPRKGREIGLAQIAEGADVLFHAANRTGLGVLKAAEERNVLGIGVDLWQGDVAPGHVPWTVVKDAGNAIYHVAGDALDGKFKAGQFIWDAAAGAQLYDQRDIDGLDAGTRAVVETAIAGLKSGTIAVPC